MPYTEECGKQGRTLKQCVLHVVENAQGIGAQFTRVVTTESISSKRNILYTVEVTKIGYSVHCPWLHFNKCHQRVEPWTKAIRYSRVGIEVASLRATSINIVTRNRPMVI